MQQPQEPPSLPPQPPAAEVHPPVSTADDTTPPPKTPDIVTVPTYSSWFRWDAIHECEVRHMQEFMDGKSPSRTPSVYKYYRDTMIKSFRANPSWKLTFTEVRRTLVGDVGSIRRVFDFLDTWGLINYSPPSTASGKKDKDKDKDKDKVSNANAGVHQSAESGRKSCSGCKVICTIACFVSDKYDLVLCARCYVRGNYPVGVNSTEFRRVEISEPAKTDWTDKETLQLLEAVMHYRDDWKRVAEHVGGRTEKECVARFIKLPFQEQLADPADMGEDESMSLKDQVDAKSEGEPPVKRLHLTPLADASNPIMAQAAFLSALAGSEVSEAAARAAIATLYDMDRLTSRDSSQLQASSMKMQEPAVESSGSSVTYTPEEARIEAESLLKQEEDQFLKSITDIIKVKMKEILDKIDHYEERDLQLEREWQQLHQMKHQLFLDKLTLSFHKAAAAKSNANVTEENVRAELPSTN